jgi:hypothetical protein
MALATIAAAFGTVGALVVIYQQLKESRREAAADRERFAQSQQATATPLLALIFGEHSTTGQDIKGDVALKFDGTGVAYGVELSFFTNDVNDQLRYQFRPGRVSLGTQRPADQPVHQIFEWKWLDLERVRGRFEVAFVNPLNRRILWIQPVWLGGNITHDGPPSIRTIREE